nr:EOG090X0KOU [Lepidurus arcticus]
MGKSVFVTVGTTSFDDLIKTVLQEDTLQVITKLGYTKLTLQIGKGQEIVVPDIPGLNITWYRLKPSILLDFQAADLVISHAGAGSCLEALQAGKQLLVVINESLMGNHQLELAEKLYHLGHASITYGIQCLKRGVNNIEKLHKTYRIDADGNAIPVVLDTVSAKLRFRLS